MFSILKSPLSWLVIVMAVLIGLLAQNITRKNAMITLQRQTYYAAHVNSLAKTLATLERLKSSDISAVEFTLEMWLKTNYEALRDAEGGAFDTNQLKTIARARQFLDEIQNRTRKQNENETGSASGK